RRIVRRRDTRDPRERPQTLFHPQDFGATAAGGRTGTARTVLQGRLDLTPQPDHRGAETPAVHLLGLQAVPPPEQPVRQPQQLPADRFGRATTVNHRLKIAAEMTPADLAAGPRDPIVDA